jgi:hypothetical protein
MDKNGKSLHIWPRAKNIPDGVDVTIHGRW